MSNVKTVEQLPAPLLPTRPGLMTAVPRVVFARTADAVMLMVGAKAWPAAPSKVHSASVVR